MVNTRLFLDMDGVFCDFERGSQELTGGISSRDYPDEEFWPLIMKTDFFQGLHPMKDAEELWTAVRIFLDKSGQHTPIFLTGCPKKPFREAAEAGKEAWVRKHFLRDGGKIHVLSVPVEAGFDDDAVALSEKVEDMLKTVDPNDIIMIFCRPDQKYFFTMAAPIPILLDDRKRTGPLWTSVRKDAIFLHHLSMPSRKANYENKSTRNNLSENAVKNSIKSLHTMNTLRNQSTQPSQTIKFHPTNMGGIRSLKVKGGKRRNNKTKKRQLSK
jgi:hypothetical protein